MRYILSSGYTIAVEDDAIAKNEAVQPWIAIRNTHRPQRRIVGFLMKLTESRAELTNEQGSPRSFWKCWQCDWGCTNMPKFKV
jgi:hypothetical protein